MNLYENIIHSNTEEDYDDDLLDVRGDTETDEDENEEEADDGGEIDDEDDE